MIFNPQNHRLKYLLCTLALFVSMGCKAVTSLRTNNAQAPSKTIEEANLTTVYPENAPTDTAMPPTPTTTLAKAQIGIQKPLYLTYDPEKWNTENFNWGGGSYEILINKKYGCILRDNEPKGTPENWQKNIFTKPVGNLTYEINSWTNIEDGITLLMIYHYPPGNFETYRRIELVNHQLNAQIIIPIVEDINLCVPEAEEVLRLSEEEIVQLKTVVDTTQIIPMDINNWTKVIKGKCWTGSLAIYSPEAWRCISGNQIFDPCFSNSSYENYVICTGNPLIEAERIKLKLTVPLSHQERENRFYGWRFIMEDNSICDYHLYPTGTLTEDEMRLMKLGITYSCDDGSFLVGNPNINTIWTIQKVQLDQTQSEITDSKNMSVLMVMR